jgi:hypothetical protein
MQNLAGSGLTPAGQGEALERLLRDGSFVRDIQHRVGNVVATCLAKIFYRGKGQSNIGPYAAAIGRGLERVWEQHCLRKIQEAGISLHVPLAVLYVNTLGIRFKIASAANDDGEEANRARNYDLRAAAFLGDCFADNKVRTGEERYNEKIFARDSTHLLKLACDGSSNQPFAVVLAQHRPSVPLPDDRVIVLPNWSGPDGLKALFAEKDRFQDLSAEEQNTAYSWFPPETLSQVARDIGLKLGLANDHVPDERKTKASIFNLYRLHLHAGHRQVIGGEGVVHLLYLPEVVMPNLTPAGFAGYVQLDPRVDQENGIRLFSNLQALIARCFSQSVEAAEAVGLRVTVMGGLESQDSWRGRYISDKAAHGPIPLIGELRAQRRKFQETLVADRSDSFCLLANKMLETLEAKFLGKVHPSGQDTPDQTELAAADHAPLTANELENRLQTPILGYGTIAEACHNTFCALWKDIEAVNEGVPEEDTLLNFLKELYEHEPSLHLLAKYRDHFVHSLHVFMLGLWLLVLKHKRQYAFFRDKHGEERRELLRLWLMASCLHDTAYPIQKVEDGTIDLFRRYTAKGLVRLDKKDIEVFTRYSRLLRSPSLASFFYERAKAATDESGRGTQRRPLFFLGSSKNSVSAGALATCLLERALDKSCHGVWGAMFLHNHFFGETGEPRTAEGQPGNPRVYKFRNEELTNLCIAVAFHHYYERFILMDSEKRNDPVEIERALTTLRTMGWRLAPKHELLFLLILCDALAQWGRTRERDAKAGYSPPLSPKERWQKVKLCKVEYDAKEKKVVVVQHYADAMTPQEWKSIVDYTKVPLQLLSRSDVGRPLVEVVLANFEWTGFPARDGTEPCMLRM